LFFSVPLHLCVTNHFEETLKIMKKIWIGVGLVCALSLAGCGGGEEKKAETTPAPAAAPAASPVEDANAATVTGKVTLDGAPPAAKALDMSATPFCAKAHPEGAKSEEVVANAGALKNAFVYIKSGLPDKTWPAPSQPVLLDQKGCMYSPHVVAVMAGQNIEVKNSDQTNHNIHPLPKVNQEWNESQPPGSEPKLKSFAREEILVPVKCNIHPWMRSYIAVMNHPFFAVTGDDGTYTIKGLPPGTYTITVWHEKLAPTGMDQQITVGAKESKTQDFTLKG
jgi:plastocyanin